MLCVQSTKNATSILELSIIICCSSSCLCRKFSAFTLACLFSFSSWIALSRSEIFSCVISNLLASKVANVAILPLVSVCKLDPSSCAMFLSFEDSSFVSVSILSLNGAFSTSANWALLLSSISFGWTAFPGGYPSEASNSNRSLIAAVSVCTSFVVSSSYLLLSSASTYDIISFVLKLLHIPAKTWDVSTEVVKFSQFSSEHPFPLRSDSSSTSIWLGSSSYTFIASGSPSLISIEEYTISLSASDNSVPITDEN